LGAATFFGAVDFFTGVSFFAAISFFGAIMPRDPASNSELPEMMIHVAVAQHIPLRFGRKALQSVDQPLAGTRIR